MAFFKFRSSGQQGGDEPAPRRGSGKASPVESIEAMRRRARHRLIGAAVLVLLGVIGFPLLFDTQPRPIPVDIPIEIPDKNKVKPLAGTSPPPQAQGPVAGAPAPVPAPAPVTSAAPAPVSRPVASPAPSGASTPAVTASASLGAKEEVVAVAPAPAHKPASAPVASKPEAKPEHKPEAKPEAKPSDAARARALLEGKPAAEAVAAPAGEGRFIVQIGAFAELSRAKEARQKVEKAGLKTYTQEVETAAGKRIRVRVGPFASRAEADKAAGKIKGLDLPAAILTL